jgi:type II secretory pathway component PulF
MATFHYIAKYSDGDLVEGSVDATTQADALVDLEKLGLVDIEFHKTAAVQNAESADEGIDSPGSPKLSNAEQVEVASVMRDVIQSGAPLATGLASLAEEVPSKSMRSALNKMATQLESGMSLEQIADQADSQMPSYLVGLIRSGTKVGNVAVGLDHFVKYSRQQAALRRVMHGTMLYSYCVGAFALLLGFFLFGWIIPQFGEVYDGFDIQLPALTESILWTGKRVKWLLDNWQVAFPTAIGLFFVIRFVAKSFIGRARWRRLQYRLPLVGPMLQNEAIAEFCVLLALQVRNQVKLPDALSLTAESLRDDNIREGTMILSEKSESGEPLDKLALELPNFPHVVVHALSWERKEGSLVDALHSVGELHAAQTEVAVRTLQAALEPMSVITIGVIVGFAVVGLFMPMIKLMNDLS